MEIQILSKNYTASQKLKQIIEKKIERLDRYFSDTATARVVCSKEKDICKLELTIMDGGLLFRSEVKSDNMYQNIDMALPKVEKQIIKYSGKLKNKFKKQSAIENEDWIYFEKKEVLDEPKQKVIKTKSFDIVPLSVEDAQMYLESSDHAFYVYLNAETGKVNIMYKRTFGGVGIIEPIY